MKVLPNVSYDRMLTRFFKYIFLGKSDAYIKQYLNQSGKFRTCDYFVWLSDSNCSHQSGIHDRTEAQILLARLLLIIHILSPGAEWEKGSSGSSCFLPFPVHSHKRVGAHRYAQMHIQALLGTSLYSLFMCPLEGPNDAFAASVYRKSPLWNTYERLMYELVHIMLVLKMADLSKIS